MSRHIDAHRRSRAVTPATDAIQIDLVSPPVHAGRPSSGTEGFFQVPPRLANPFHDDFTFCRVFHLLLPAPVRDAMKSELSRFGELTLSSEILRLNVDAEHNTPRIEALDSFGRPKNALLTTEGWRHLTAVHHREGLVATGYQNIHGHNDRLHQFLKTFLWSPSSGGVTCPAAMQDGAAGLLTRLLANPQANGISPQTVPILRSARDRLTSRDPLQAWTSGQWMTERPGGSDVRNTETLATYRPESNSSAASVASDGSSLGPYSISGFKWFSSATDANMTVLLAKTPGHSTPSLFFAPVHRTMPSSGSTRERKLEHNGIQLSRLKSKLGTRSLPTAELILKDCRGYLLGKEGQGVKEISTVLNITRIHNAVGAVSAWSRALAVARAWSKVRSSGGRKLEDWEGHVRGLAEQTVNYHAATLGVFFGVGLLGRVEHGTTSKGVKDEKVDRLFPAQPKDQERLLRLLTPVLKATTALKGIEGVRACMESMGGVGYLENTEVEINLAKLLRDTMVLSIWEGTTEVMALDVVRVLKGRDGKEVLHSLERWAEGLMSPWKESRNGEDKAKQWVRAKLQALQELVGRDANQVTYHARKLLGLIEEIFDTILVVEDARDASTTRTDSLAQRWIDARLSDEAKHSWKDDANTDSLIVFGKEAGDRPRL
ncbi:Hypothetical protein D9617_19g102710 [Elsinoe fawcettii]|nr:Hypothetical protein D9617_19g102710 [Elsinoe fawcettii]